ncbi:hypothetical protein IMZ31_23640 (plasmid) [Pontibacillus sp. ALD_SL1]|uniref:hypothetical protein n=1 Tax=Pontibacillus sp. ALD_SL1 TaxID=2777185 RepID=UPI001A95DF9B|nr:hypothetical protein [Pontibacillus sp. ALD_SL1]QST02445.1 hypothetical protein IMZ31_23640 [Pontibacillus sp. ALD_SL1]
MDKRQEIRHLIETYIVKPYETIGQVEEYEGKEAARLREKLDDSLRMIVRSGLGIPKDSDYHAVAKSLILLLAQEEEPSFESTLDLLIEWSKKCKEEVSGGEHPQKKSLAFGL